MNCLKIIFFLSGSVFLWASSSLQAQTAEELTDNTISALGGLKAFLSWESYEVEYKMSMFPKGEEKVLQVIKEQRLGEDKVRITDERPAALSGAHTMTTIINGERAWVTYYSGEIGEQENKAEKAELKSKHLPEVPFPMNEFSLLLDAEDKGFKVSLGTDVQVDDKNCRVLVFTQSEQKFEYLIDSKTNLPYIIRETNTATGLAKPDKCYTDYKKLGNANVPHTIGTKLMGRTISALVLLKYVINPDIDVKIFSYP